MRLIELHVDGFGKLADRTIAFDPGVNVVYGPNEAGKSTLTQAIVATLYGHRRGKRELWKPWNGGRYATRLRYALGDGREFEIQRDFEHDGRTARLIDRNGNDLTAEYSAGKTFAPADAHLGMPLEVFLNASCVEQGAVAIDGARAERIGETLRQALDGGPKEDAALGALARLEKAIATHVGTKRATKNAPQRKLQRQIEEAEGQAAEMRERLGQLGELRTRLSADRAHLVELRECLEENEHRRRAQRAHVVRTQLEDLRIVRDDLSALQAERALYDDVADFPKERVAELEVAYATWTERAIQADEAEREVSRSRVTPSDLSELAERLCDGGALDDVRFAELEAASRSATEARTQAAIAADAAVTARRDAERGRGFDGTLAGLGLLAFAGAIWLGFVQLWIPTALAAVISLALLGASLRSTLKRGKLRRTAAQMQQTADTAVAEEQRAATQVQAILAPLGVPSLDELRARRHRYGELRLRKETAERAHERAGDTARRRDEAVDAFDALARALEVEGETREATLAAARIRASRKSAREGIESRLNMLDVQRGNALGGEEEYALEQELAELLAAGATAGAVQEGLTLRIIEAERATLERRRAETEAFAIKAAAQLEAAETHIGSLAEIDERIALLGAECARLEEFEAAVTLARTTIEERTRESHHKFARRLEDYAVHTLAAVTNQRYREIRVDPTTLAVRVRAPETGAIVDLDVLSAGTREQAFLVVRLAMARMFGEGLEPTPLLLDDPFAYWDDERIARGFPILRASAAETQTIVFTTSRELAEAAQAAGLHRIDLAPAPELVPLRSRPSDRRQPARAVV
jgi:DNA repair exonuclease SbcCD ATPase subunit